MIKKSFLSKTYLRPRAAVLVRITEVKVCLGRPDPQTDAAASLRRIFEQKDRVLRHTEMTDDQRNILKKQAINAPNSLLTIGFSHLTPRALRRFFRIIYVADIT